MKLPFSNGVPFLFSFYKALKGIERMFFMFSSLHTFKINTLRPRQNGRHFADDTFKPIFLNENIQISIKISLKFVPKVPINNIPALVQIMAWCQPGDKPLSEPIMVCLLTHICVTRPQWVNSLKTGAPLLTLINFNHSMVKWLHPL